MDEVNSARTIPKSKRRWPCRVIGVFLALGLAVALWPRADHDQRFVGAWREGWITYELHADGSGTLTYLPPPAERSRFPTTTTPIRWWNEGRILCVDMVSGSTVPALYGRLKRLYLRRFHPERSPHLLHRWQVEDVNESQLSHYKLLHWGNEPGTLPRLELLQRVTE